MPPGPSLQMLGSRRQMKMGQVKAPTQMQKAIIYWRDSMPGRTACVDTQADGFGLFQKDAFDLHDGDDERLDANLDLDTDSDSDKDSTPAIGQQAIHLTLDSAK